MWADKTFVMITSFKQPITNRSSGIIQGKTTQIDNRTPCCINIETRRAKYICKKQTGDDNNHKKYKNRDSEMDKPYIKQTKGNKRKNSTEYINHIQNKSKTHTENRILENCSASNNQIILERVRYCPINAL